MGASLPEAGDVTPERRGKRWTRDEDDLLFALVRGPATPDEIAATLRRTVPGVYARVDVLIGEDSSSDGPTKRSRGRETRFAKDAVGISRGRRNGLTACQNR